MKANPTCRVYGVELNEENWYASLRKRNSRICKSCCAVTRRKRRQANREVSRLASEKERRARGVQSMSDNKDCAKFLGCHIAERVLSYVFENVERMPMDHPGYDVICNRDKKIDIKSSCRRKDGRWMFHINRNPIADFFLCIAFDNREDLNPLHLWLIPGCQVNDHILVSISESRLEKWNKYSLDIAKTVFCCEAIKKK